MADPTLDDVANHLRNLSEGQLMDAIELIAIDYGLQAEERCGRF